MTGVQDVKSVFQMGLCGLTKNDFTGATLKTRATEFVNQITMSYSFKRFNETFRNLITRALKNKE